MELVGNTAIITGGSGRLGGEIALGLARAGCDVIVHYCTNESRARQVAAEVEAAGRKALVFQGHLTALAPGDALLPRGKVIAHWADCSRKSGLGPVRFLVNSAAVFVRTPVGGIGGAEAVRVLELDLLAPILLAQAFAGFIAEARPTEIPAAKIINIADVGGQRPWKQYSVYCAAKAGLIAATKALAKELAPAITVNAVAPGLVTWPQEMGEADRARQLTLIPAGRPARPDEVADAVVFLLRNDYITGQVINVDGGRTA